MTHPPTALLLEFHGTRLVLEVEHGAGVDGALRFLGTHLAIEPLPAAAEGARPPLATLRIAARRTACPMPPPGTPWEDVYVRKSASEFFTIPARRARADGREYLECVKTGTRFVFDRSARTIDISLGSGGGMDFVELVRDLVLKDQENAGTVVLHAGAAYREGAAVLVVGAKGAGKSTVLLELVERFGYRILSGDKTLLHELPDGSIRAVGWPDYPHLGYGTIVKYPGLKEIAGIEDGYRPAEGHAFSPVGKFAVDPFRFRDRFPGAHAGCARRFRRSCTRRSVRVTVRSWKPLRMRRRRARLYWRRTWSRRSREPAPGGTVTWTIFAPHRWSAGLGSSPPSPAFPPGG